MRMIARFCFFVSLFLLGVPSGVSYAQGETKIAKDPSSMTADPSPWEKEAESGIWHLKRDAPGGKWQMAMGVVDGKIHFTIMIPCENGYNEIYSWKRGDSFAHGKSCTGRNAGMSVGHLKGWIDPLPREVQRRRM